jgi:hypothetical protein
VFRLGDEHDDIFGGKFEALTIWNAFSGDGVAWPARIDAANSEAFTAGIKFAPKSAGESPYRSASSSNMSFSILMPPPSGAGS